MIRYLIPFMAFVLVDARAQAHAPAAESRAEKMRWLDKTARMLRSGDGLSPNDPALAWVDLPREEIVSRIMKDPRFYDTILDFGMYFWGAKIDLVMRSKASYDRRVFSLPQAISAARAMAGAGGQFLSLLEKEQPLYFRPLFDPEPRLQGDSELKPEDLRALQLKRIQADLDRIIQVVESEPGITRQRVRDLMNEHFDGDWFYVGLIQPFVHWVRLGHGWYGDLWSACRSEPLFKKMDVVAELKRIREVNRRFFEQIPSLVRPAYVTPSVKEIKTLDAGAWGVKQAWTVFNRDVNLIIPNSSTNFNRKRAAFFLSRLFCDDLTPIGVAAPEGHAGGRHASEPACRACHYKLDPMAGFFKSYGIFFKDFSDLPFIRLEDDVQMARTEYDRAWLAEEGAGRKWDIGYVRSDIFAEQNQYGESLEDLFGIFRTAPEVKRCMVKRFFEYFVSDAQAVDAGYLDWLTSEFQKSAQKDSNQAVRETITRIVTSRSFTERDPIPDECYDFRPGWQPGESPPCKVAAVLERNCISCHGPTSAKGGLDLSRWTRLGDGSQGFPHVGAGGAQKPRQETLQSILERLTATDLDERMPLRKFMSATDREQIYLWATKELAR